MSRPVPLGEYAGPFAFDAAVLVVGTGPVGLALRSALRARGRPVVMLEAGGAVATRDSARNAGASSGLDFSGIAGRARGLGGNSALWAGQAMRFHAADFERRPWLDGSGWPIGYDTLAPYYAEAEDFLGVPADAYHAAGWRRFGLDPAALPDEGVETRFSVFTAQPDLWRRDRAAIEQDTGTTVVHDAVATGFRVEHGAVTGVEVRGTNGPTAVFRAPVIVLATGAIEAARLLLAPSESAPDGIGGGDPHVGAHFQDHPHGSLGIVRATSDDAARRALRWFTLFHRGGVRTLPKLTRTIERQAEDRVLNACAVPVYEWPEGSLFDRMRGVQEAVLGRRYTTSLREAAGALTVHPGELARYGLERARGRSYGGLVPRRILLQVYLEQDPATGSRITLGRERDSVGMPVPVVDWRLGELERRTALGLLGDLDGFFRRLGVGPVEPLPALAGDDWRGLLADNQHHAGTARMSAAPAEGVVDRDGRMWRAPNVFVTGGAVFPTSSYANPTLTMIATALRLARHLTTG